MFDLKEILTKPDVCFDTFFQIRLTFALEENRFETLLDALLPGTPAECLMCTGIYSKRFCSFNLGVLRRYFECLTDCFCVFERKGLHSGTQKCQKSCPKMRKMFSRIADGDYWMSEESRTGNLKENFSFAFFEFVLSERGFCIKILRICNKTIITKKQCDFGIIIRRFK